MKTKILIDMKKERLEKKILETINEWVKNGITTVDTQFSTCFVDGFGVQYSCLIIGD